MKKKGGNKMKCSKCGMKMDYCGNWKYVCPNCYNETEGYAPNESELE